MTTFECAQWINKYIYIYWWLCLLFVIDREAEVEKFEDHFSWLLPVLTPGQRAWERGSSSHAHPISSGLFLTCLSEIPLAPCWHLQAWRLWPAHPVWWMKKLIESKDHFWFTVCRLGLSSSLISKRDFIIGVLHSPELWFWVGSLGLHPQMERCLPCAPFHKPVPTIGHSLATAPPARCIILTVTLPFSLFRNFTCVWVALVLLWII